MMTEPKSEIWTIEMIANCLAQRYLKSLFLYSGKKNYASYIDSLSEILDWSIEFYDQHFDAIISWENHEGGCDFDYNAFAFDELIVEFGNNKIETIYARQRSNAFIL